jgi:hypothetical protein
MYAPSTGEFPCTRPPTPAGRLTHRLQPILLVQGNHLHKGLAHFRVQRVIVRRAISCAAFAAASASADIFISRACRTLAQTPVTASASAAFSSGSATQSCRAVRSAGELRGSSEPGTAPPAPEGMGDLRRRAGSPLPQHANVAAANSARPMAPAGARSAVAGKVERQHQHVLFQSLATGRISVVSQPSRARAPRAFPRARQFAVYLVPAALMSISSSSVAPRLIVPYLPKKKSPGFAPSGSSSRESRRHSSGT